MEMSFLWRVPGLSLRKLVIISVIREELRLEQLHIKKLVEVVQVLH